MDDVPSKREVVLDTETTGLDPRDGHRIVEIGAVELINHLPTGETFQCYIDPERDMPDGAFRVHGLSREFLQKHPVFVDVLDGLLAFLSDSPIVIHNAAFDISFLNAELQRAGRDTLAPARALDTLGLAQRRFPGGPNSLDALCRRFAVDASARTHHGALLDSELLAEVYLHLIGGRQTELHLTNRNAGASVAARSKRTPQRTRVIEPSASELATHEAFVKRIKGAIWNS